jgi:NAD(P)-dependent dehydrogenase (short-subunit alcohol dehydrogenase family)
MARSGSVPPLRTRRRALVVGGSGGIGREAAFELASRDVDLVIHGGHSQERLERTVAALRAEGGSVEGFLLDIATPRDLLELLPRLGRIDILVVAFGPFLRRSLASTSDSEWERLALLDFALPGALVSHCLREMKAAGWGRILLFGGTRTDAIRAYTSNAAYAAAKTGLAVIAKSAAAEGAAYGVACIQICPGLVDTEYLDDVAKSELAAKAPGGSLIDARHLVSQAMNLLLAEPCTASGAVIAMDSGLIL